MKSSKGRFTVNFRGVRGSYPVAQPNFLNYGGNTACVEVNVNNHLIILDAGTGIIGLGDELMQHHISTSPSVFDRETMNVNLFLSHIHQDHIQGLPFFKPAHVPNCNLNIFGYSNTIDSLDDCICELLFSKSFPLDIDDLASNLSINDFDENFIIVLNDDSKVPRIKRVSSKEDFIPKGEEVIISALKSFSHPQSGILVYKIAYKDRSIVYATDIEGYVGGDKKLMLFARDTDLLIHDSQYSSEDYLSTFSSKQGFGHSTFDMAVECFKASHAKKLAFYHYEPTYDDKKLLKFEQDYTNKEPNSLFAHEGQEIVIL